MNKPYRTTGLNNGVHIEFFTHGNRYFGDFHRVEITVIATIPLLIESLPDDLLEIAASYPNFIQYEKTLEKMGVATDQVESVRQSLIDDFLITASVYLEKKNFAECLLIKNMENKPTRNSFSL